MEAFEKIKSLGLFFGILLIIIGVVFLVFPENVISFLAFIVSALIIGFGLFRLIVVFLQWKDLYRREIKLVLSLLMIAAGIFIVFNTHITVTALGVVIGIFAILLAFDRFNVASLRKKAGMNYSSSMAFGFIHLAFGIGMFYSAFTVISIIISIIGVYLLIAGIMVILSTSFFFDFE